MRWEVFLVFSREFIEDNPFEAFHRTSHGHCEKRNDFMEKRRLRMKI